MRLGDPSRLCAGRLRGCSVIISTFWERTLWIGTSADDGIRFPDMSAVYDVELRAKVRQWAHENDRGLKEGVYLATTGPSFETPAEIRAFAVLGADAVGMSTVPEAIVARQLGMCAGLFLYHESSGGVFRRIRFHTRKCPRPRIEAATVCGLARSRCFVLLTALC